MATQQEIDTQTGLHNTSGYDQSGNRIAGGQVDNYGTPTNQAITPNSLQQNTPVQPTVAQPVANPTVPDFLQVNQQEQQATDQYTAGQSQYADLLSQLAGRDAYTTGQQAQQDVIGKQANVTNYQNQIKALQQEQSGISLQREQNIQAKQQAMSGQGISDSIVNRHSAIDTQYNQQTLTNAIKQYSVGAQLSAAQGDLTSALNYVDQAVKLKYQPIEAQITAQNANLEAIKNNPAFTSAQRKQAAAQQLQLQQYTQNIADEKKAYQDTQDAIIKTVTNNPNITPQQNAAISAAQSPSEVAQLVNYFGLSSLSQQEQAVLNNTGAFELSAGQSRFDKNGKLIASVAPTKTATSGGTSGTGSTPSGNTARDAESVMNGTLNLQDISVKDNYRAGVAAELANKQKEALKSGDMAGVMRASAAYDKEPSDTFLQSMEKTLAVVSQLGTLQENIAGTNTGPIVGAFRGANPWDTNAQTIKAQLNAIVPNLARGVYGEVGVLTDNDIKQYAKTIPTLTSTEDIRNAILYITLNQIRKNVEIKIQNQASGQRDMSGYADVYSNLDSQVKSILDTLPKQSINKTEPLKTGSTGQTSSGIKWSIE